MRATPSTLLLLTTAVTLSTTLTACGGDGGSSGGSGATKVKTDKGVTGKEITVGILNDFSGPIAALGTPGAIGGEARLRLANDQGGICGRQIKIVKEDTKYDPQVTIQAYRASSGKVLMYGQLLGTASITALKDQIARDGIPTLAASRTATVATFKNVYIYLAPTALEAVSGIDWAARTHAGPDKQLKLGVVYQNDPYGKENLAGARFAAAKLGNVKIVGEASYVVTDEDFTAQVQKLKDAGAEAVWLGTTPKQTAGILGQAGQLGYKPQWLGATSSWATPLLKSMAGRLGNFRTVITNESPGANVPAMAELQATMKKYFPKQPVDSYLVTGWAGGETTVAALRKACESGDLTRAGVTKALAGLTVDMKGLTPNLAYGADGIPTRAIRIARIDETTGLPAPETEWFVSDAAKNWTIADNGIK